MAALAHKKHDLANDTLTYALTNAINPPLVANGALTDLTQIVYTGLSTRIVVQTSSAQSAGLYKLTLPDLTLTASGTIPAFQYVTLYNATAAGFELIGFYDYGTEFVMSTGETFLIDNDQANAALTVT